jgi:starch-binding outer membrane protein, SusD/RagB family
MKKMKTILNIKSYYFLILMLIVLPACHDQFLEEKVFDFISPNNFYNTDRDAIAAVNACYDALQGNAYYGRAFKWIIHFPSDEATNNRGGGTAGQLDRFTYFPDNGFIQDSWNSMYIAINRSNAVLENVPNIEMDETLKARLLGEARFLRALNYFNLVRLWGDVPLVTKETRGLEGLYVTRNPKEEVYQLIIEDLQFAEQNLPASYSNTDKGRATSGAATGLLAKVYLTREQWNLARDKAKEVIDSGLYGLFDNYADAFAKETKNGIEHLFAIQGTQGFGEEGTQWTADAVNGGALGLNVPAGGSSTITGEHEFWEEWDKENDLRYDIVWFNEFIVNGVVHRYPETTRIDNPHIKKFLYLGSEVTGFRDYPLNYDLLRYADVLLMYSEAENEVNGPTEAAYSGVNQVRARAGLGPLSGLSKEELTAAILDERKFELCFEFNRWFDLVRRNLLIDVFAARGVTVEPYRYLFPIPQDDLDRNPNLEQNPGY